MRAFVTVGSTRFDALVQRVLSDALVDVLRKKGYSTIIVQCGNSDFDTGPYIQQGDLWTHALGGGGVVEVWKFKPSLQEEYEQADLVISHAGSGTILDVLRLRKPLIVVPNSTLLDDHQQELATALAGLGHIKASTIRNLPQTISSLDPSKLVPFPSFDGSRFREILDEEMGYALGT
ncbi:glycosyltransferase family 1 protein [Phlebiopsis gigantea 11061_1 CR5-6]|uniref:UDP-N-acetylglucosamine transferase subunit ALG13 n=1 Tax=Phlebiopsis gigantea (strain 11061_1 CR5-6) TaxID=745531 RepID=A0A0C3SDE0_PHLG1|nr:glycosyltransferase family 1 protein [Phlebiopsis gigantea 11061_1 CR5-6]